MKKRMRYSISQLEVLPTENIGRLRRGLSMDSFYDKQLMESVRNIEKENRNLRLENILYSRYLRRVENPKIIEIFEDYNDENDGLILKRRVSVTRTTTIQAKLPEIARRSSTRKSSVQSSSPVSPLWSKLVSNWRTYIYTPYLERVEQEKLSIADYEIEQTQLEWDRMKTNSQLALDHLDDLLRAVEFDETAQTAVNADFQRNMDKLGRYIKPEQVVHGPFFVPAELIIRRIHQRIHSHINSISLLRINNTQTQQRIRYVEIVIRSLDDEHDQMDEIDLNFVRTRKIDYLDTYEKLDRKYKIEKSSQYPLFHHLRKYKRMLTEREQEKLDDEYRYQSLQNYCEKLQQEIESIQSEIKSISKENLRIKNRISDVKNVPTITEYAHIIEQTKKLQHEIDIWTQRVNVAQVSFMFLK